MVGLPFLPSYCEMRGSLCTGSSLFLSSSLSLGNSHGQYRSVLQSLPPHCLPSHYLTICLGRLPQLLPFIFITGTPVTPAHFLSAPPGADPWEQGSPLCVDPTCPQGQALCLAQCKDCIKRCWMHESWWQRRGILALTRNWQDLRCHQERASTEAWHSSAAFLIQTQLAPVRPGAGVQMPLLHKPTDAPLWRFS